MSTKSRICAAVGLLGTVLIFVGATLQISGQPNNASVGSILAGAFMLVCAAVADEVQ